MFNIVSRLARLQQIDEEMSYLRGVAARTLCQYGVLMAEVERDALWREAGAKSFDDWLKKHHGGRVTSIRKGMRIARLFSPDEAALCGTEKCEEAVRLLAATPRVEPPGSLMSLPLRYRGPKGRFETVVFAEATPKQVRAARRLTEQSSAPREKVDAGVASARAEVGARVQVTRHTDGELRARPTQAMSAAQLRALADALDRHARKAQ